MKSIIFLALVCLAAISELALARHSNLHEWTQYKKQHGKEYKTPEEDSRRFSLFLAAKEEIRQHNAKEHTSYKLGLNQLSDWTPEERAKLYGYRYDPIRHMERLELDKDDSFLQAILEDQTPVPAEVDWRKVPNRVSAVKNQGHCGSCWAFATTGLLEGQQVARNFSQKLIPLSEQELVDCSHYAYNSGCVGGDMGCALTDIAKFGIESEKDYPYVATANVCELDEKKSVMTDSGYAYLPDNSEETLKEVVAKYGPVSVGVQADYLKFYKSGIFDDPNCKNHINHAVLVVGYGTDPKHGDYWIVKNSWSESYGEKGYFRMKRGVAMCGIGETSTIAKFDK